MLDSGSSTGSWGLSYDRLGRLLRLSGGAGGDVRFLWSGAQLVAEYDAGGAVLRRYAHGDSIDRPLVWYEGAAMAGNRRYLYDDERGSVLMVRDDGNTRLARHSYDDWGRHGPPRGSIGQGGRFGYTGQLWLDGPGMYHFKARAYAPELGRFLQPDPIGIAGGLNLHAYAGGDPVNYTDPWGLKRTTEEQTPKTSRQGDGSGGAPREDALIHVKVPRFSWEPLDQTILAEFFRDAQRGNGGGGGEGGGGGGQNPECSRAVPNPKGKKVSANSARRQFRAEQNAVIRSAMSRMRYPGNPNSEPILQAQGAAYVRAYVVLQPGGRFDTNPGNVVYGAVMSEAGFPTWVSRGIADALEIAEFLGIKASNDPNHPLDTRQAQDQIVQGAACPG